jgi:phosphatidylethanolamine-binding protein (PEBP) family uncharacterized protein
MTKVSCVLGVLAVGGLLGSACSSSSPGGKGSGGASSTGGKTGTGGSSSTGGQSGSGGSSSTGGQSGTGGTSSVGGTAGSAGAGGAGATGGGSACAGPGGASLGGAGGGTSAAGGTSSAGGLSGGADSAISAGGNAGGSSKGGGGAGGTSGAAGTTGAAGRSSAAGSNGAGGIGGAAPTCQQFPPLATGSTTFTISSPEFAPCAPIPIERTCDQKPFPQGTSPALTWTPGPAGTKSYAVVLKDLAVLARYAPSDSNYNKGFHYVMWDMPPSTLGLPANMMGGHISKDVQGAQQWSSFNDYGYFGPCPNFDPTMPTSYDDSYAFIVYALPAEKTVIPAPQAGISTVRRLDGAFQSVALATAEYRGTSRAASSGIPAGVLPPTAQPPCATDGSPMACGCLSGP